MRIVPSDSVLHYGAHLKRFAWIGALLLAGCAKSPSGASAGNFTRIHFRIEVAGRVNTPFDEDPNVSYVYAIAIRASSDTNPLPQYAPLPVLNDGTNPNNQNVNPNGIVAGSPTHLVLLGNVQGTTSTATRPYILYRFPSQTEAPNTNDPDNPVNITTPILSNRAPILNFEPLDSNPQVIEFDLFTNQLVDVGTNLDAQAQALTNLQVNFLTMTRPTNTSGSERLSDSLGNQLLDGTDAFDFINVNLLANNNYTNSSSNIETEGDLLPRGSRLPDIDIVNWSIEVRRP